LGATLPFVHLERSQPAISTFPSHQLQVTILTVSNSRARIKTPRQNANAGSFHLALRKSSFLKTRSSPTLSASRIGSPLQHRVHQRLVKGQSRRQHGTHNGNATTRSPDCAARPASSGQTFVKNSPATSAGLPGSSGIRRMPRMHCKRRGCPPRGISPSSWVSAISRPGSLQYRSMRHDWSSSDFLGSGL
jgi:hypothetical protein